MGFGVAEATLQVEGRTCAARPMRGSASGSASGVAAVIGSADVRQAASWLPGRIAIVRAADLTTADLRFVIGSAGDTPFSAAVILVDELNIPHQIEPIACAVPVVLAGRAADRFWLERALHVDLTVASADTRPAVPPTRPAHPNRTPVALGAPGTVQG